MSDAKDTVIIPCAGSGTRLRAPVPKELLPVAEDRAAIDTVFDLLLPHAQRLSVLVVIDAKRALTVAHLGRYTSQVAMAFVLQQPCLSEVTGAVRSALHWAGARSLVLLPDQVLRHPSAAAGLVAAALDTLADVPFCFLAAAESDAGRIGSDGALRLALGADGQQRVTAYADKPGTAAAAEFNAIWFGYGFRREAAHAGLEVMHRATLGQAVTPAEFAASPLAGCPALKVGSFTDIGTWAGWAGQLSAAVHAGSGRASGREARS
jgi:UTP-glucose-1-phosphate uridylyltransferase